MQKLKYEQGQTLVEFALILPILLVLVIGIFDFGQAFNYKNDLNFLANTAARYAEVNQCTGCPATTPTSNTIASYVKSTASTTQLSDNVSITFCLPNGTSNVGDPLKVSASTSLPWLVNTKLPGLPTGTFSLSSTATVRILQAPDPTTSPALYSASAC